MTYELITCFIKMWKFLDATSHIFCKTTRHSIKMHSILSPRHDRFSYTELSKNWMEYDDEIQKQPLQKTITWSNEHQTHKGYNTFFFKITFISQRISRALFNFSYRW